VHPVNALAPSALNPPKDRPHAYPKRGRDITQALPCAHRTDHLATPFFQGKFLTMTHLAKRQIPYTSCSANAETHAFN
jgi:hypothetical protein